VKRKIIPRFNLMQEKKSGSRDQIFWFNGKEYTSYSEMVQAKREWNRRVLLESGLLDTTK